MTYVAAYSFHYGHGNSEEIIRKGDDFMPDATSQQSAHQRAQSMILQGALMTQEDAIKRGLKG